MWQNVNGDYLFEWRGIGTLLADGLCIDNEYTSDVVPSKGNTIVYSTITAPVVTEISLGQGSVSVDFRLTMRWFDPNINTRFNQEDIQAGALVLSKASIERIWNPDLYILRSMEFKPHAEWASLKDSSVLTKGYEIYGISRETEQQAMIELLYEIKSTVHCDFEPAAYPMDHQTCNVTMGSGSSEAIFVLDGSDDTSHAPFKLESPNFEIGISFFDDERGDEKNTIGMTLKMARFLGPYILKYYIPCMGIVFLTALSFAIPVTGDTGRGSFLVTLFLTLISLFISQIVSKSAIFD